MKKLKVCWLSAGVSSFVAGYLADNVDEFIYIDIADQHEDSMRFIKDCEKAIGKEIKILKSKEYKSVEDCIRVFGGFRNARNNFYPCTNWLKLRVRKEWEYEHKGYELTYVWGFDMDEKNRAERLIEANPQAEHEFPLIDKMFSKQAVHGYFNQTFDFPRPKMYDMGYPNNNCVGCVRGGMGYWNKIRKDFPDVFQKRAKLERELQNTMLKDKNGYIYLDELQENRGNLGIEIFPECSIACYLEAVKE